ncbi:hypothetical protein [Halobacterium salinarum]|nr:hypothetical protein [Halobacterium salinarum]
MSESAEADKQRNRESSEDVPSYKGQVVFKGDYEDEDSDDE